MKIFRKVYFLWLVLVLTCIPSGCATNKPAATSTDEVVVSPGGLNDSNKTRWWEYAALLFLLAALLAMETIRTDNGDCEP